MQDYKENYLNLITSEHRNKPKFISTVSSRLVEQDSFKFKKVLLTCYDLDNAYGAQLDAIGESQGASRTVAVPNEQAYLLGDNDYRVYIKSKIVKNHWDGKLESLCKTWENLFGQPIWIKENGNDDKYGENDRMSIDVYVIGQFSQVIVDLIKAGLIIPKPVSVKINNYFFASKRIFSYGLENSIYTGYGGSWVHRANKPIFAYQEHDDVLNGVQYKEGLGTYGVGYWLSTS